MPQESSHRYVIALIAASVCIQLSAFAGRSGAIVPPVTFLSARPVIDGRLDSCLAALPIREFEDVARSQPTNPVHPASYRLAYGADFFYVYVEIHKDSVTVRDRAYQNGDGFHMALTLPDAEDSLTGEFYVMGFSPPGPGGATRRTKFVWYKNVDLSFAPLNGAQLEVHAGAGTVSFELLLPWADVYPYHPWITPAIGFNLCLVEAVGALEKNEYFVRYDRFFQSEQHRRLSRALTFSPPHMKSGACGAARLSENHVIEGAGVSILTAGAASRPVADTLNISFVSEPDGTRADASVPIVFGPSPAARKTAIPWRPSRRGTYRVSWNLRHESLRGEAELTVLPGVSADSLKALLAHLPQGISSGTVSTLEFMCNEAASSLRSLKTYEASRTTALLLEDLLCLLNEAVHGNDSLARRRGIVRRAYRSGVDSSLQPYTISIPREFDRFTHYPLLVYLHGSGEDDRGHFGGKADTLFNRYVRLAPCGRGTSNAYSADHAQEDIRESIDDVVRNYGIDTSNVILSGFSMGGYGVYRTFYESPRLFRALAVFSGHPDLASMWLGPGQVNFLDSANVKAFKGKNIFIFHGGRDRNCPIELTQNLVELLRKSGAVVEFHYEAEKGHESPGELTLHAYREWLERMTDAREERRGN